MADSHRAVECSAALYRLLLKVYPAECRREYGDEMQLVFRELATDSWNRKGLAAPLGTMLLWGPAAIFDDSAPWWGGVAVMIVTGALAWGGCYASSRVRQRPATW